MQMDILAPLRFSSVSASASSSRRRLKPPFKPRCSRGPPRRNDGAGGSSDGNEKKGGGGSPTDWDKAWSNFRKQGKKTLFSNFSPDKYVSWNPRRSEFPLSEEVDPIKRTERSNLRFWTSPEFQLTVAILIVTFLLLYTILAPVK